MAKVSGATGDPISPKPSASGLLFSRGWVGNRDLVWILAHDDPDSGRLTRVLQFKSGQWVQRIVPWSAVAVTAEVVPEVTVFVVGVDGQVLVGRRSGFADEHLDPGRTGPERRGAIRDARIVGSTVMAVGMSRQAFRRSPRGQWSHIDQNILAPPRPVAGLNSIDGFGPEDVYSVGMAGEIWRYDGRDWHRIESPTNVALQRVRCVDGHTVYACGAAGVLLRHEEDKVQIVAPSSTEENLYGLEWFRGELYVAGLKSLFILKGDDLVPVNVKFGKGVTFGDLHAADGALWSFGARHLLRTDDGVQWTQVFYP